MPAREKERPQAGPKLPNMTQEDFVGQPKRKLVVKGGPVPEQLKEFAFKPGHGGNPNGNMPKWRRELKRVWNDGIPYFERVAQIARGEVVYVVDVEEGTRIKIVPNIYSMLAAFKELRDTAVGKPVQQLILSDGNEDSGQLAVQDLVSGLGHEEQEVLREIARKALTWKVNQHREARRASGDRVTEEPLEPEVLDDES